ncbi:protein NRT1/ PTR FAMILY 2.8 [Pistacia vera]|uniref:protein NRT1/ PTR FAMILY 2.8 n=1 Tax=Pistacia vera TaxID=55513 RepID=UPI00126388A8|nr:protein NRT1/ PTR FAMILY 2.8 [Pistacia vera]
MEKEDDPIYSTPFRQSSHSLPSPYMFAPNISTRSKGGWRAVKYILGNETFEKLASMSLIANITVYLHTKYNMDGILLVNVVSIWSGTSNLAAIPGALISDTYLGRFRTLLFGSISSFLGMGVMTMTACIPHFRPPPCNGSQCQKSENWQLGILFAALALLAIGSGGIRPCNIAFGADQFDVSTEKGKHQLESFFNWWYFSFTLALIVALTVVVYIQTNVSWILGFAIPTGCFLLSIIIFLIGYHTYILKEPQGSVFIDMAKVITAAFRKRKVTVASVSETSLYDPPLPASDSETTNIPHSDRFLCLDKAAVILNPSELDDQGQAKNEWKLCSVLQVEQLKMLVGMFPVWVAGIICFIAMDQNNTTGMLQAIQTNTIIGGFNMPPCWMGLVSMLSLSSWIFIYERIIVPLSRKMTGKKRRMTMRERINTGIVMASLSLLVAGFIEKKRRILALEQKSFKSSLSILALVPQFCFSGLTEAFAAVALMEFLTTKLPESMRTVSGAIFFLSLSIASYLNSLLVNVIHGITGKNGAAPWLGGTDLNKDTLEYFYFMIAVIEVLNLIYFNVFAYRFLSKEKDPNSRTEEKQETVESV